MSDASGRMTLDVTVLVAGVPLEVCLARPSLVVTLEASTLDVQTGPAEVLDRTGCLVMPRGSFLALRGRTPANRACLLGFDEDLLDDMVRRYGKLGVERAQLDRWLARPARLSRTVWVHEIVHRYVFERHALGVKKNLATKFLEIEIVKELYFLFRDRDMGADRACIGQKHTPAIERAVAYIEANLFEPCGIAELARRSGASESTLLRAFRRELGCRPGEYWRTRRLDEALVLLRSGDGSVAQVAMRAGYENPTSFAHAFRRRFGASPSEFVRRRPTRRAP